MWRRIASVVAVGLALGGVMVLVETPLGAQSDPIIVHNTGLGPFVPGTTAITGLVVSSADEIGVITVEVGRSDVDVTAGDAADLEAGAIVSIALTVAVPDGGTGGSVDLVIRPADEAVAPMSVTLPISIVDVGGDGLQPVADQIDVDPGARRRLGLWLTAVDDVRDVVVTVTDADGLGIDPSANTPMPLATGRRLAAGSADVLPLTVTTDDDQSSEHTLQIDVSYVQGERLRSFSYRVNVVVGREEVEVTSPTGPSTEGGPDPYEFSVYEGQWDRVPDFSRLSPSDTGTTEFLGVEVTDLASDFGLRFETCFSPTAAGVHEFEVTSDDGSWLAIDGYLVVINDGVHALNSARGSVPLGRAQYGIVIDYFDVGRDRGLLASVTGPDGVRRNLDDVVQACDGAIAALSRPVEFTYHEGSLASVADLDAATQIAAGRTFALDLTQARRGTGFGFRYTTCFTSADGTHGFRIAADDGGRVLVDGSVVAESGAPVTEAELSAGTHVLTVEFFQIAGESLLDVLWSGPGFDEEPLADLRSC